MSIIYNGAKCDLYIGKGAGKKLLNDLRNAKHSVKIVSPYLSPFLIKELIQMKRKGLDIALITTDSQSDFKNKNLKVLSQVIQQKRETNWTAIQERNRWKDTYKTLAYITLAVGVAFLVIAYQFNWQTKSAFGILPITMLLLSMAYYRKKIQHKRIYSYWYDAMFPLKIYKTRTSDNQLSTFIHSKIYIIDHKIAYLGSLNFTASGLQYNYESRIRTEDTKAIEELLWEFHQLINNHQLPEMNHQEWGRQLYDEPIN